MDSFELDVNGGRPPRFKAALEGGIIVAAATIVFTMVLYVLDLHTVQWLGYVSLFASFVVLFVVGNNYKKKGGKATLTYGQAFKFLIVAVIISSLIIGFYDYFYFRWIAPEIIDMAVEQQYEALLDRGMSENQAMSNMEFVMPWMTPLVFALTIVFTFIFLGLLASLIIAALIKQESTSI